MIWCLFWYISCWIDCSCLWLQLQSMLSSHLAQGSMFCPVFTICAMVWVITVYDVHLLTEVVSVLMIEGGKRAEKKSMKPNSTNRTVISTYTMLLFSLLDTELKQKRLRNVCINVPTCVTWLCCCCCFQFKKNCVTLSAGSFLCFRPFCILETWPTGGSQQAETKGWMWDLRRFWLLSLTC